MKTIDDLHVPTLNLYPTATCVYFKGHKGTNVTFVITSLKTSILLRQITKYQNIRRSMWYDCQRDT